MKIRRIIKSLRKFRLWHRYLGIGLAFFLFISAISGILLSLKKDFDFLQPPTQTVLQFQGQDWLTVDQISVTAQKVLAEHLNQNSFPVINKIDIRPDKGIAKVIFNKANWEVQLNAYTGEVLSIAKRNSDWIEDIHDGSIISEPFKLFSMNAIGFGLLIMIGSGFWLWYGPKKYRQIRRRH